MLVITVDTYGSHGNPCYTKEQRDEDLTQIHGYTITYEKNVSDVYLRLKDPI